MENLGVWSRGHGAFSVPDSVLPRSDSTPLAFSPSRFLGCALSVVTRRNVSCASLVAPAARTENGYRHYGEPEVHTLRFVQRARSLGFSVAECRDFLALYFDRNRTSASVKAITRHRIADIDQKIAELEGLRETLADLAEKCHGDDRPDCPILADLAGGPGRPSDG